MNIVGHLSHVSFNSSVPHRTIKLFLIGDGERGKTTLLRRLRGLPEEKAINRTEGIDIEDWHYAPKIKFTSPKPQVHFLAWDFAGQVKTTNCSPTQTFILLLVSRVLAII